MHITGYDLKKAIYTTIDADIPEPGSVLIGARLFCEMLRRMPDGIVTVEAENGTVSVKCGKAAFNLVGLSADDYPDLPVVEAENGVSLPQDLLKKMINECSFAVSTNESRPVYMGTLFEIENNVLTMVSINGYRLALRREAVEGYGDVHADFSGGRDKLTLAYRTVSTVADALGTEKEIYYALCDHQEQHRRAELDSGQCLTGAHKDDLLIDINGQSARAFASQGQTRTAALSLKLAEREIFHDEFDEYPVLMLDDVLSELDAQRQAFVLNRIGGGQTLITCCEDARIAERTGGRVLTVENGVIR